MQAEHARLKILTSSQKQSWWVLQSLFLFSNHGKICLHFIATIFRYEPYQREPKQHLQYGLYHAMYSTNFHFKGMTPWSRPFFCAKFRNAKKTSCQKRTFCCSYIWLLRRLFGRKITLEVQGNVMFWEDPKAYCCNFSYIFCHSHPCGVSAVINNPVWVAKGQ